jgi:hypothetical protein
MAAFRVDAPDQRARRVEQPGCDDLVGNVQGNFRLMAHDAQAFLRVKTHGSGQGEGPVRLASGGLRRAACSAQFHTRFVPAAQAKAKALCNWPAAA